MSDRFAGLAAAHPTAVTWEEVPFWRTLPYDPPLTQQELASELPALLRKEPMLAEDSPET
jgi:hypothetical protein